MQKIRSLKAHLNPFGTADTPLCQRFIQQENNTVFFHFFSLPKHNLNATCSCTKLTAPTSGWPPQPKCCIGAFKWNHRFDFVHRSIDLSTPSPFFSCNLITSSLSYSPHILTPHVPDKTHLVRFCTLCIRCHSLSHFEVWNVGVANLSSQCPQFYTWKIQRGNCKTFPTPAFDLNLQLWILQNNCNTWFCPHFEMWVLQFFCNTRDKSLTLRASISFKLIWNSR